VGKGVPASSSGGRKDIARRAHAGAFTAAEHVGKIAIEHPAVTALIAGDFAHPSRLGRNY
jgi:hypothetical protein